MFCEYCGHEVKDSDKYCNICGQKLGVEQTSVPGKKKGGASCSSRYKHTGIYIGLGTGLLLITAIAIGFIWYAGRNQAGYIQGTVSVFAEEIVKKATQKPKAISGGNAGEENSEYYAVADNGAGDVWNNKFPQLPEDVTQKYYVIFNEGSRNNRVELSAFDIYGDLNDNYIVWYGIGRRLELHDHSVISDCDQFYLNGDQWVKFYDDYLRMSDNANAVIYSNLDIYDSYGNLILEKYSENNSSEENSGENTADYMLPDSDVRYISEEELEGFTEEQCKIARNEIFARHGRIFEDEELAAYFSTKAWYHAVIMPDEFDAGVLNDFELKNLDVIVAYEKEQGYR